MGTQAVTVDVYTLGIISKLNDAKKDEMISSGGQGVGIDIISISSFLIFLASQ